MQGDLNAGGHNVTNAATVNATNVVATGSLIGPLNGTNIVSGSVANSQFATMAANTIKANATGSTATPTDAAANTVLSIPRMGLDANGTAINAATGAYNGQWAFSTDGDVRRWNGTNWNSNFVFDTGNGAGTFYYVGNINQNSTNLLYGNAFSGYFNFQPSAAFGTYLDNVMQIENNTQNSSGGYGYSSIVFGYHNQTMLPAAGTGEVAAGIPGGGPGTGGIFSDAFFFELQPDSANAFPLTYASGSSDENTQPMHFLIEQDHWGTDHALYSSKRFEIDGAGNINLTGITPTTSTVPAGLTVNKFGRVLLGGATDDTANELQVTGTIRQSGTTSTVLAADSNGKLVTTTPALVASSPGLPRLGVDASGTALIAATGAFQGQLGLSKDGYLTWWNGSNWTSSFNLPSNAFIGSCTSYSSSESGPGSKGIASLGSQGTYSALHGTTGDFTGQLGISSDGHVLLWNGSNWNGAFNFGGPLNDNTQSLQTFFSDVLVYGHLQGSYSGSGNAPTVTAGSGAGTSPTVSVDANATDIAGTISVTTGTSPTGSNATVVTLNFFSTYLGMPHVILTPHNAVTAALNGTTQVFGGGETTAHFTITSGSAALAASTAYQWDYHVIQ